MDRLRIGTFTPGGRFAPTLDINDGVVYSILRDAFKIKPPERRQQAAAITRRYGGSHIVGETHDNGELSLTTYVAPSVGAADREDSAIANADALITALESTAADRFLEWRPDGATKSTYYELRGPGSWDPSYRWVEFQAQQCLQLAISVRTAPLAQGDPLDIFDPFDVDSLSDYTFDAGSAGDWQVSGGVLDPVTNLSAEQRIIHTARGYMYEDCQATLEHSPGAITGSVYRAGVVLKRVAANTYLSCNVLDAGGSFLVLDVVIGGVSTNRIFFGFTPRLVAGTTYWFRARIEGNGITVEHWTSEPTPMGTPAQTQTYMLVGAEITNLGAGVEGRAGLRVNPQHTSTTYDDFRVEPFTYRNQTLPKTIQLGGTIPGNAPAKAALVVTPSGGPAAPIWALLSWAGRAIYNRVWNGDFEVDVAGWSAASDGWFTNAATSITRVTTTAKYGAASAQIVTSGASANQGGHFRFHGMFFKGVTYSFSLWARASSGTADLQTYMGDTTGSGDFGGAAAALSPTWQLFSGTFTPTADRSSVVVGAKILPATAQTFQIDGVQVYQGTVVPSLVSQQEGRGGFPPFGVIEAESASSLTTWTSQADGNYRGGNGAKATTSGAGIASAEFLVDPATLLADDFTAKEVDVEVWGRIEIASTVVSPTITLSTRPDAGTSFGQERFSHEWGAAGKLVPVPTSGTQFRFTKLGTLTMYVDPAQPLRWKLRVASAWAAGSSGTLGLDYIIPVLARQRAGSPSGKPNDSTYPKFVASTAETQRLIRSDLSGMTALPPNNLHPDQGLGGQLIELNPGNVDLLVKLGSLVPDDTTAAAGTEQLAHSATVQVRVIPRYFLGRGG